MKASILVVFIGGCFLFACQNNEGKTDRSEAAYARKSIDEYDPLRGEGKFHDISLSDTINPQLVTKGVRIYEAKCRACHKLTDEQLVGPGWAGVTKRRRPEWILNFVTNPDPMLDKDPELQALLEICLVRMPNQNINDQNAFAILEFMRKNDRDRQ